MITLEYIKQIVSSVLVDYEEEFINELSQYIYDCHLCNSESELTDLMRQIPSEIVTVIKTLNPVTIMKRLSKVKSTDE